MTTPVEIINLALKQAGVLGVGQTASAEDLADCYKLYNFMMAQWSRKRNIVHQLVDIAFTATGALTYTVGIGEDFNTPRPAHLIGAYARQLKGPGQPIDFPLELMQSITDYSRLSLKQMSSMPMAVWYDPQFPVGVLHVWPVPDGQYEIHILCLQPLPQTATAFDDIVLPDEYMEALMYNLAGRLCVFYQIPMPQGLPELANASLATLRASNLQLGKLYMPSGLVRGNTYNFYADI